MDPALRKKLIEMGATMPKSGPDGLRDFLARNPLGPVDPDDPNPSSRALEEQREERLWLQEMDNSG